MIALFSVVARALPSEVPHSDEEGIVTHSPWFPEQAELIYGTLASVIIFTLLYKLAGPAAKKAMAARTERIQKELDAAASDEAAAEKEAADIRQAKGDIEAERTRMLAEAAVQAESVLDDGRIGVDNEMVEMLARADAEIASSRSRGIDELRAEITRLSSSAADLAVAESIDDATHQELVEAFISKVGAST
jgi:F-type H+-transporting ATPase subunit b